jgi:hypothetical protein
VPNVTVFSARIGYVGIPSQPLNRRNAMTQVSKPKQNVFEDHALTDDELDAVSGGAPSDMTALSAASQQMTFMMSACDNVIKTIGDGFAKLR